MPGTEFFARMAPEFAQHVGLARESATRQAEVERLIATAEYECYQLRRELGSVMAGIAVAVADEDAGASARTDSGEPVVVHSGPHETVEAA